MSAKPWKITGSYIPRRLEMLESPAWKQAPRPMKELLEILEVELMRHKGATNGRLFRSYSQFIAEGFNRNTVSTMTKVAEALGFLKIDRSSGVRISPDLREASCYTLTYLPTGIIRDIAPTDEWKRIKTPERAAEIIAKATAKEPKVKSRLRRAA